MGNQVSTNNLQNKKIGEFENYNDPSLGDETNLQQISPLHRYTNYQTTLPIKSIASISQKQQILQSFKGPTLRKQQQILNQVLEMKQQQSLQRTKFIQQKQNLPFQFLKQTKSYTSVTHIRENSSTKNITGLQKQETEFKSLVINFQDFIDIKEQKIDNYYEFKEVLGEGAYGQVFKAICRKTGEERAIKKIKKKNMKEKKRKEFMSQLNLLSKLCHPSIIVVYDVFINDNKYYVVMQYCKGGAVVDMLHKCKYKSQNTISYIIKQLLSALSYMHSQNIVHRDIKLDNIVFLHPVSNIRKTGHTNTDQTIPIKIIDFGTAVAYEGKQLYNYPLAGTLSYLAPEVMRGVLTTKSDIWSVGVLLTILLTGKSPFKGPCQSVTKANINSKQLKFNEPSFNSLSAQAKELIGLMLERNFRKRISAEQALNHPWFSNSNNQKKLLRTQNLKQLFLYQKGNNLISVIQSYISLKRISQQQRQRLGEIFNAIDTNGNGTIEINEIIQIYTQNADQNITNQEIMQIIKSIDKDKSGKIDFNEFIVVMEGRKNLFITEFLADAFDYYDQDKTGYLDRSELTEILKGGDLTEIDKIIKQLDKDGDKCISKQEFIFYFKNY